MKLIEGLEIAFELKKYESRRKTTLDYSSLITRFIKYWTDLGNVNTELNNFNKQDAFRYLDHILLKQKVLPVTRNNYLTRMKALFYVLVDREYITNNPFAGIKLIKITQKKRRVFSSAETSIICNFLKDKDNGLLLAISLCYYCALRPAELRRLKIEDIDLRTGMITLDGRQTKNKNLACITMPNHLIDFLKEIRINKYPLEYFVFGTGLRPMTVPCGANAISDRHRAVLKQLAEYKLLTDIKDKTFYSWKDTAARDMIEEGINAAALMKHFRHSSLETTQKYLESFGVKNDRIRELKSKIF